MTCSWGVQKHIYHTNHCLASCVGQVERLCLDYIGLCCDTDLRGTVLNMPDISALLWERSKHSGKLRLRESLKYRWKQHVRWSSRMDWAPQSLCTHLCASAWVLPQGYPGWRGNKNKITLCISSMVLWLFLRPACAGSHSIVMPLQQLFQNSGYNCTLYQIPHFHLPKPFWWIPLKDNLTVLYQKSFQSHSNKIVTNFKITLDMSTFARNHLVYLCIKKLKILFF